MTGNKSDRKVPEWVHAFESLRDSYSREDAEKWRQFRDDVTRNISTNPNFERAKEAIERLKEESGKFKEANGILISTFRDLIDKQYRITIKEPIPEPQVTEPPKRSKLTMKNITGVELVTLTIMILQKNGMEVKGIENVSLFIKTLLSSIRLGKKYEVDSFRVKLYDFTSEQRDYPSELKVTHPRKHDRLLKYLQSDSGKEFERIVIESM